MTSSFQSTAFQSAASPVDTFVAEPRVLPKTGAEELATILQVVNPALQQFIGQKIEKAVDKERKKAVKDRIFDEINKGKVAKLTNNIRKEEGNDTARKIIGGSRIYRQQYEKTGVQLEALKFKGNFKNAYDAAKIDTGEVDSKGQPIFRFLRE